MHTVCTTTTTTRRESRDGFFPVNFLRAFTTKLRLAAKQRQKRRTTPHEDRSLPVSSGGFPYPPACGPEATEDPAAEGSDAGVGEQAEEKEEKEEESKFCTLHASFFADCGRKAERECEKSDCPKNLHRNPVTQTNLHHAPPHALKG